MLANWSGSDLQLAQGARELYFKAAEHEEMAPAWIAASERADADLRDVQRVTAELSSRWRTQRLEHEDALVIVGRLRLHDEVERLGADLAADTVDDGEQSEILEALAAAARLLESLPESWLIPLAEAAQRRGVTDRRMRQLCLESRVPGAHKRGKVWWLPADFVVLPP